MKKLMIIGIVLVFLVSACGDSKELCFDKDDPESCQEFETYGFIDRDDLKDDRIRYKLVKGNIVWSILLSESIVGPILLLGFDAYEPVSIKKGEMK